MPQSVTVSGEYSRQYRKKLGFTNASKVQAFFGAKDIIAPVDFTHIELLKTRLYEMVEKLNNAVAPEIQLDDVAVFKEEHIDRPLEILKENKIFSRLNNQGRRPESVYFNWMRGYVVANYFLKALGIVFSVDTTQIDVIGEDDLKKVESFNRSAVADLELPLLNGEKIRVEMQSGYKGVNDIKKSKVMEAKRAFRETGIHTLAIHFDLYNGRVAFVRLDTIEEAGDHWVANPQFEGVMVFRIDEKYFTWRLTEKPAKYEAMIFD